MTDYPEALIQKVVRALASSDGDLAIDSRTVLDALGFAPYVGSQYWRSAIHVEDYK